MRRLLLCFAILLVFVASFATSSRVFLSRATLALAESRSTASGDNHLLYLQPSFFAPYSHDRGVLSVEDVMELKNSVAEIQHISIWDRGGLVQLTFRDKVYPDGQAKHRVMPLVGAVTPQLQDVFGIEILEGRFFSEQELQDERRLCLIGGRLHERLGGGNVIGESLSLELLSPDGGRAVERFIIVGVLKHRLPLYSRLSDRLLYWLIPYILQVSTSTTTGFQIARSVQREQLAAANFALNESVLVPYSPRQVHSLSPHAAIYLQLKVPEDKASNFVLDRESMIPIEMQKDVEAVSSYWPQGVAEIGEKIRGVLKQRLGSDKVFQLLYQGTYGDYLRLQSEPLVTAMGVASLICLPLALAAALPALYVERKKRGLLVGKIWIVFLTAGAIGLTAGLALAHVVIKWL